MLAEDPVRLAIRIHGDVVIAAHLGAIPPARLDALGTREQFERSLEARLAVLGKEALRTMQEPCRPTAGDRSLRRSAALARAGRAPVALRAMVVLDRD